MQHNTHTSMRAHISSGFPSNSSFWFPKYTLYDLCPPFGSNIISLSPCQLIQILCLWTNLHSLVTLCLIPCHLEFSFNVTHSNSLPSTPKLKQSLPFSSLHPSLLVLIVCILIGNILLIWQLLAWTTLLYNLSSIWAGTLSACIQLLSKSWKSSHPLKANNKWVLNC